MIKQKYDRDWASQNINREFITFWREKEEYGFMSQFYLNKFVAIPLFGNVPEQTFVMNEQWMMANKALLFNDHDTFAKMMRKHRGQDFQDLGREVRNFDQVKWNLYKYDIVLQGQLIKYEQNPYLKKQLIRTDDAIFVEASPKDKVWGVGMDENHPDICEPLRWKGENLLGFVHMETRDILNKR